ncbi:MULTISPECIES: DUF4258 domain-containing protein [Pseudanabaena]|jgi:hypothetical protein|uniref:DUF4258 domain-containing protein n=1 Tax=Pseudanabaena TaxID=1152 RepID=UPI0024786890|nr:MULTISPECIES: DUF4258 domain-containing protein [Pseudanabaena]MEA5486036.1 DUF4258 domain-containing protein [Pseudanabaena sp. CCNP1317]WGS73036.1 DUF4258 domain-containing protein [Pseudanabaena galeata CCNP1313]
MKTITEIRSQLQRGDFEFSRHALKRAVERNISEQEIMQIAENASIIEEYPDDKYSPSCLIFGITKTHRPLHLQVSMQESAIVKIITIYEPDPNQWIQFTRRK